MEKIQNYWTKERCVLDAKKYKTKTDWAKNSRGSHHAAYRNGWFDLCSKHMQNHNLILNDEFVLSDATKYRTKTEWKKKSFPYYNYAKKHGLIQKICFIIQKKPHNYWTKERCILDAKKYKTKTDWAKNSISGYGKAQRNNWLSVCCEHMEIIGNKYNRMIYSYEFPNKYVYIGLTGNPIRRKNYHLNNNNSPVKKHINKYKEMPKYKELTNYLDKDIASCEEKNHIKQYKIDNWKILNIKRGGGLGGITRKWTYEKCRLESLKHETKKAWRLSSPSSYNTSIKNNWINEFSLHLIELRKPNHYWTYENCLIDSKKYNTKSEWKKNSYGYVVALKNKWIPSIWQ